MLKICFLLSPSAVQPVERAARLSVSLDIRLRRVIENSRIVVPHQIKQRLDFSPSVSVVDRDFLRRVAPFKTAEGLEFFLSQISHVPYSFGAL